ncbi:MAG: hypothetical protein GY816_17830 [Cytophagales bacterium]|nr:hypothetical protein [Cytophagales bacterium]
MFSPSTCRNCNKPIAGRSDKRFCDASCRNSYNNQNKADDERQIQQINSQIRKNRRILKTLCPQGKATVRKEVLDQMGYDYLHFSSLFKTSGLLYYFVYDFGFAPTFENKIEKAIIVQRQDYMSKLGFDLWKH